MECIERGYKFEGGGWEEINKELVMTWMSLFLLIVLIPGIVAFRGCVRMDVELELNRFNSFFYKLGVFHDRVEYSEEVYADEISVGMFFVNVNFVFWKINS